MKRVGVGVIIIIIIITTFSSFLLFAGENRQFVTTESLDNPRLFTQTREDTNWKNVTKDGLYWDGSAIIVRDSSITFKMTPENQTCYPINYPGNMQRCEFFIDVKYELPITVKLPKLTLSNYTGQPRQFKENYTYILKDVTLENGTKIIVNQTVVTYIPIPGTGIKPDINIQRLENVSYNVTEYAGYWLNETWFWNYTTVYYNYTSPSNTTYNRSKQVRIPIGWHWEYREEWRNFTEHTFTKTNLSHFKLWFDVEAPISDVFNLTFAGTNIPYPIFTTSQVTDWNAGNYTNTTANATGYLVLSHDNLSQIDGDNPLSPDWGNRGNLTILYHFNNQTVGEYNGSHFEDFSGYGHNATCSNCPTYTASGKIRGAFTFDGINDAIDTDTDIDTSSGVTVVAWIKTAVVGDQRMLSQFEDLSNQFWVNIDSSGVIDFGMSDDGCVGGETQGNTDLSNNEWHQIAVIANTSYVSVFEDGQFASIGAVTGSCIADPSANWWIGARNDGAEYFTGTIDEVAIYNRTLNATEIQGLYDRSKHNYPADGIYESEVFDATTGANWDYLNWTGWWNQSGEIASDIFNTSGLVAYYKMNNDSLLENNTHIYDWTGNGHNGTVTNAITTLSGKIRGAFEFDNSTGDNINLTSSAIDGAANATWCAWVKPGHTDYGVEANILKTPGATGTIYLYKHQNTEKFVAAVATSGGSGSSTAGVAITDTNWHFVCGVYNGSYVQVYVDVTNIDLSPGAVTGTINDAINFLHISDGTKAWDGTIDEVTLWTRPLSVAEITKLYYIGQSSLRAKVRSCDDSACAGESWSGVYNESPINLSVDNNQYFQYRIEMETDNRSNTSWIRNLTIDYRDLVDLDFFPPTPANDTSTTDTNITVNVSINTTDLEEITFNFNDTNYTFFNESLILLMTLNNDSIGEYNASHFEDYSGTGNNATCTDCPALTASGKYASAYNFDGTNDIITVPYRDSLNATNYFSISLWFKADTIDNADQRTLVSRWSAGGRVFAIEIETDNTTQAWIGDVANCANNNGAGSTSTVTKDVWYHAVTTYNGTHNKIYLDGALEGTSNLGYDICRSDAPLIIGTRSAQFFNGTIDEIGYWNRTLSDEEVSVLYNTSIRRFSPTEWSYVHNESSLPVATHTYYVYAENTNSEFNITGIRHFTVTSGVDSTAPTFENNQTNSTTAGQAINHSVFIEDETALDFYVFSFDNGTGTFVNDTPVDISGTGTWANVTKYVNETVGSTIQCRTYANDTTGNWNSTLSCNYITTSAVAPPPDTAPNATVISPYGYNTTLTIDHAVRANDDRLVTSACIWTNESGWAEAQCNTSQITNNTIFLIQHTYTADGTYAWGLRVVDNGSNVTFSPNYTLQLDTGVPPDDLAPNVTLFERSTSITTANPEFNMSVYDDRVIDKACLYYNFSSTDFRELNCNTSVINNTAFNITANLSNGYWLVGAWAIDNGTNETFAPKNISIALDTTAPIINITGPLNRSYDSNQNLNYFAEDNLELDTVQYNLNGGTNTTIVANGTALVTGNGFHNVSLWVNDTLGNLNSTIVYYTVTAPVPDASPNATIFTPPHDSSNTSLAINFSVRAWDDYSITSACIWTNESGWAEGTCNNSVLNNTQFIINHTFGSFGAYTWGLRVVDNGSNVTFSPNYTIRLLLVVPPPEDTAPNATIINPPNGNVNTSNNTQHFVRANDDRLINKSCIWGNVSGWQELACNTSAIVNNTAFLINYTWNDGFWKWGLWVEDNGSNVTFSPNYTMAIDTTPPNITILQNPVNDSETEDNFVEINVSCVDNLSPNCLIEVIVNGSIENSSTISNNTNFNITADLNAGLNIYNIRGTAHTLNETVSGFWLTRTSVSAVEIILIAIGGKFLLAFGL